MENFVDRVNGIAYQGLENNTPGTRTSAIANRLFAYKNCMYLAQNDEGWNMCDIIKEYVRQGIFDSPKWRVSSIMS